jgi:serine/threonine-protein kinase HipA
MNRQIKVFLGDTGTQIGTLFFNASSNREGSAIEYTGAWLRSPDQFQLDPALPLTPGRVFRSKAKNGSAFHGAIADTEPDGWARRVIQRDQAKSRREAKERGEPFDDTPLTSVDYLLAVDDFSRIGALRFQDEDGIFQRAAKAGRRRAPPLVELDRLLRASRAVETNTETAADLQYLRGRGTSVGGQRPKCSVISDEGVLSIGKFPSVGDLYAVTKGEVLALRIAAAAGINAAESRLIDSDGVPVALIKRFDRDGDGRRLPYVSAATLLGIEDSHTDHAYTQVVDALLTYSADFRADAEELWRRIALTVLINNVDDHLHNHGFLHVEKGKWRLSPAFDINPFPDKSRALKTWVSEASGDAASIDALMQTASYFRIAPARAREILAQVEAAVARWREIGAEIGMITSELDAFEPAFEHPERAVARHAIQASEPAGAIPARRIARRLR